MNEINKKEDEVQNLETEAAQPGTQSNAGNDADKAAEQEIDPRKIISDNPETIEEAEEYINGPITSWIGIKGNNDNEFNKLQKIIGELKVGKLSPKDAAERARGVFENKHDK